MRSLTALVPLAFVSIAQLLGAAPAGAQTPLGTPWVPVGPVVGSLQEVERSPLNPQLVVAVNDARLVRSLDGGATFADVPLGLPSPIRDIEFGDDGVLFVGTGSSLLVSFDGGITFIARSVPAPPNSGIATLAIDPQDSTRVWAGLEGTPRVLRSLDGGATWADVTPSIGFHSRCIALDVDPTDSSRVIAVNEQHHTHVTLDSGMTWNTGSFIGVGDSARDVAFVGANLVLVTNFRALLSTNFGGSWSTLPPPSGTSSNLFFVRATDIEVDRSVPGRVYISSENEGVYASQDSGASWAVWTATAGLPVASMASGALGSLLLASPSLGLVEVSLGSVPRHLAGPSLAALGLAHAARPLALTSNPAAPLELALVATDPATSSETRFLLVSGDGGASWDLQLGLGARPITAEFAPDGRLFVGAIVPIVAATSPRALLRRDPQGWTPLGPTGFPGQSVDLLGVAVSARQPALVFASSVALDPSGIGGRYTLRVHRSVDGGASWTTVYTRVADWFAVPAQIVMTERGATRAVHLLDGAFLFANSGFALVWSTRDDGGTWSSHALVEHQSAVSRSIALAPANPGRLVVTDVRSRFVFPQPALQHTDDGGITWVSTGPPLVGAQVNVGSNAMPDVLFRATSSPTSSVVQRVEYAGEVAYDLDMTPGALGLLTGVHVAGRPERVYALATDGLYAKDLPALVGASACGPAVVNSTGVATGILAIGTTSVAATTLTLRARRVPLHSVGLFLVSDQLGFVPGAGGSSGALCLAGAIGRFGPNLVQSGTTGEFELDVDLTMLPRPTGLLAVQAGQTWSFQVWFPDTSAGAPTSNFSDAVSVTFTP